MKTIEHQLAALGTALEDEYGRVDVVATATATGQGPHSRRRAGATIAVVAAGATLVFVGALPFLLRPATTAPTAPPSTIGQPVVPTTLEPSTTTTSSTTTTTTPQAIDTSDDVAVFTAALVAWYSGDFDGVRRLIADPATQFGWTDDEIRGEIAYQSAIGARVTVDCLPDLSNCDVATANAITDALGWDPIVVSMGFGDNQVVANGQLTMASFLPERYRIQEEMWIYLATNGLDAGYEDCLVGRDALTAKCAEVELANLTGFVQFYQSLNPTNAEGEKVDRWVETYYAALERGDCTTIAVMTHHSWPALCETVDDPAFELAIGAHIEVLSCDGRVCEISYSNAMHEAIGAPPRVLQNEYGAPPFGVRTDAPLHDRDIEASFDAYVEAIGGSNAYQEACRSGALCAAYILDHLDAWATWQRDR